MSSVLAASQAGSDAVAEVFPIAAAKPANSGGMHAVPARSDSRSYKLTGDVRLLLEDSAGRVLFGLRQNTSIGDGAYHLPAGHVEEGESVIDTVVAEAEEELGITIDPEDVEFAHVMHTTLAGGRTSFIFRIRRWQGIPRNREPRKCRELRWFSPDALPKNMISDYRQALKHIAAGVPFSVCGWEEEQAAYAA